MKPPASVDVLAACALEHGEWCFGDDVSMVMQEGKSPYSTNEGELQKKSVSIQTRLWQCQVQNIAAMLVLRRHIASMDVTDRDATERRGIGTSKEEEWAAESTDLLCIWTWGYMHLQLSISEWGA